MPDRISALSDDMSRHGSTQSQFDAVSEITSILAAIPDRTAFLGTLLKTARKCFLSDHEAILSYHAPSRRWFVEAAHDLKTDALDEINGLSRTVIDMTRDSAVSILIADAKSNQLTCESRSVRLFNIQSVLTSPILVGGELWGLIYLANTCVPNAFDSQSQQQIERFSAFAGMAITRCEELVRFSVPPLERVDDQPAFLENVLSPKMMQVIGDIKLAAPTDASILLCGETGTGKDVIARWIHEHSSRRDKPFIQINCAELDVDLIELELFGIESGVATGVSFREGRIKVADGGTVFLNEIGELPLSVQAKLLRVIEDRVVERVGGRSVMGVDVRFICATHRDLETAVNEGQFRSDLYHRINVFSVNIPPLRDRLEDIPQLAQQILFRTCDKLNRPRMHLSNSDLHYLSQHNWKGNIRELANLIEQGLIRSRGDHLDFRGKDTPKHSSSSGAQNVKVTKLKRAVDAFEASHILQALQTVGWVTSRAARRLGIPTSTLRSKMKKLKIGPPRRLP